MPELLPLFPLGTVLLPGAVLPLHVFEDRYRVLVGELLSRPEDERVFGVVAIRQGREVGVDGVSALHAVGTAAHLVRAVPHEDGRYDVVTVGARRFRLEEVERGRPYAQGRVTWLDEEPGRPSAALDAAVREAVGGYVEALGSAAGLDVEVPALPADPVPLSFAVAGSLRLDEHDRQGLLEAADAAGRLRTALGLLRRETALLRTLSCVPAPELLRLGGDPN